MKTVHQEKVDLNKVVSLTKKEPVLLLTKDGRELFVSEADDFDREVEMLRNSAAFQKFLAERSACQEVIPLEVIEKEIEQELANERKKRKAKTRKS